MGSVQKQKGNQMDDLINRQDAIETSLEFFVEFLGGAFYEDSQKELIAKFQRLPSVQPQRTGKWHVSPNGYFYRCQYCGKSRDRSDARFCWYCGARMEGAK